jgi:phage shock protein A
MVPMDTKRTRRTPDQLIAETEARLAKLQARQAQQEAKSNPLLAPVLDLIKDQEKVEMAARKGFSKGPANFDERIAKAQARIVKIESQMANAETEIEEAKAAKASLRSILSTITQRIAQGEELNDDDVQRYLEA